MSVGAGHHRSATTVFRTDSWSISASCEAWTPGTQNETFNTLKNQGYNYEHNYGHGKQNLSSTLAGLMLLSFLIDQLQQHACQLYKTVRKTLRVQKVMWESMRSVLRLIDIPDWETLWRLLGKPRSEKAMWGFIDTG